MNSIPALNTQAFQNKDQQKSRTNILIAVIAALALFPFILIGTVCFVWKRGQAEHRSTTSTRSRRPTMQRLRLSETKDATASEDTLVDVPSIATDGGMNRGRIPIIKRF